MKTSDLAALIQRGIRPVVTFNKSSQGPMTYVEAGMRGRLTGCQEKYKGTLAFLVDLSEFEAHNKALETADYRDKNGVHCLTAREAGLYRQVIEVYVDAGDIKAFDIEGESLELLQEYMSGGSADPYTLWLERQLLALRSPV